jgi:hypothetical protein
METVKFPGVTVPMVGQDGNVFSIIGRVKKALERAGHREAAHTFVREARCVRARGGPRRGDGVGGGCMMGTALVEEER